MEGGEAETERNAREGRTVGLGCGRASGRLGEGRAKGSGCDKAK